MPEIHEKWKNSRDYSYAVDMHGIYHITRNLSSLTSLITNKWGYIIIFQNWLSRHMRYVSLEISIDYEYIEREAKSSIDDYIATSPRQVNLPQRKEQKKLQYKNISTWD